MKYFLETIDGQILEFGSIICHNLSHNRCFYSQYNNFKKYSVETKTLSTMGNNGVERKKYYFRNVQSTSISHKRGWCGTQTIKLESDIPIERVKNIWSEP